MKLNKGQAGSSTTFEGGKGFQRETHTELFLRATTSFAGEKKYYESGEDNLKRIVKLAHELAVSDWEWYSGFVTWLRKEGHIRTSAVILASEGVHARLNAKQYAGNRQLVAETLQRPDELKEIIAYELSAYGRSIPISVKRGVGDAARRMLNQRQALRYDNKPGESVAFGDVIELCHVRPRYAWVYVDGVRQCKTDDPVQSALFKHLITARHNRDGYEPPLILDEIRARWELNRLTPAERHEFAALVQGGDREATAKFAKALAGQWEWAKSWLGAK